MNGLRDYLALAGKGDRKIYAVFGHSASTAVRHLSKGAPDIPVWLFTLRPPDRETTALCERVFVFDDGLSLLVEAEKQLWPHWVALGVAMWTGERGSWAVKLAPFLVPPFRTLLMNEHGDFFAATPAAILRHAKRRVRDGLHAGWNRARDIHRGAWLWLFAFLAQRSAPLSRWAFHKWHGQASCSPTLSPAASSDTVDVFRYQSRYWNWDDLTRFVQSSTAQYLVFQTADGDFKDLLPLFAGDATFAVSRQTDFRDWKPSLFATAPFRRLQPGEAAQTLAPVSDFLLVDRAKLLALGIPKTVVPGTAWLLIFWRAAAAGWRSYSVGNSGAIGLAADWPYEEAEFVTRVLSDPALRGLGPTEPDLARGNIAFSVGAPKKSSQPTVLVVSPYLPYPLSHGGAVRIYNLCRALATRMDFTLACFREKNDVVEYAKLHEVFREVYVVDRDEKASRDSSLPQQVREHSSASMRALISKLKADILQVEFTHLAHFRDAAPETPAILVEHDLTFTLYRQFAERSPSQTAQREYERWLGFERCWMRRYNTVWTMSDEDCNLAAAEGARSATVANGVDIERFVATPGTDSMEVFYVGSFRHLPNIIGFDRLRREVMPVVWSQFPGARLRVVAGPEPERYWRAPSDLDSRIQIHGFVEDLRPLYAGAAVVAVPLEVSAGTNIKVMEAMACGRTVVSTPIGCAGLGLVDGHDALIRSTSVDFAAATCELLGDRALRESIARQARRTVEQCFSWNAIAEKAHASYLELRR